jgi:hypothetical protein
MKKKPAKGKKPAPRKKPARPPEAPNGFVVTDFDALLGKGNDLGRTDEEFEEFLAQFRRWRREGLERPKRLWP